MKKHIAIAIAAIFLSESAFATNVVLVESSGDVRIAQGEQPDVMATSGTRLIAPAIVSTGPGGHALVRFDDGQTIALTHDSSIRVATYAYTADQPDAGRSTVDFLRGGMRFLTGLIGKARHENVAIRARQATIGIRGTDIVVIEGANGLNISVIQGGVVAGNPGGNLEIGAGQTGVSPGPNVGPSLVRASTIPGPVTEMNAQLVATDMAAGPLVGPGPVVGTAGASGAVGLSAGTLTAIGVGAVVIGVAAAASSHSSGSSSTPPPTGTTGTH